MSETDTAQPLPTKAEARGNSAAVEQWVVAAERQRASLIMSPQDAVDAFERYKKRIETDDKPGVPTFTGWSHEMGFASEDGYRFLAERGGEYASTVKRICAAIVDGVVQRMVSGKANQVGCIFYLKNRAGFRDKSADEVAAEREDWLTKLRANQGEADREIAPPRIDPDAQPLALQDDNPDSDTPAEPVMRVV